jgi:mannose-6-phosphate isomerase-like protein (cupin superfamily)
MGCTSHYGRLSLERKNALSLQRKATFVARVSLFEVEFKGITVDVRNIDAVPAFTTKDGSEIRELLARRNSSIRNQSLAEARVAPGQTTTPHYHPRTEEIYYILSGEGQMRIGDEARRVGPGDAIAIPPGERHQITNTGREMLKFLCCCAPGYEHDDTVLVEAPR